jgi:hypothetical protein
MEEPGRYLTRREFEDVMRRAAELASEDSDREERAMSESEVVRIGREVGLSENHVRRALLDVRSGRGMAQGGGARIRVGSVIRSSRVVPGDATRVASELDDFLVAGQLLQAVRKGPGILVYRPAVDWASQVARAASSTSRRYYVASAKHVEVRLSEADEGFVLVDFEVDPGFRGEYLTGVAIYGSAAGVVGGLGAAALLSAAAMPLAILVGAGVLAGGGLAGGVTALTGRHYRNKMLEVRTEVEGILDRLESGESLEPPPPSWRRWVKRHFHGVARDLRGDT